MTAPTPPIPASCAHRPTVGGLVAPYVNAQLADGGVDFRSPHQGKYEQCLRDLLCQTCGQRLPATAVFFGGPNQLASLRFDEPPLCPPCAVYAAGACPMVAGRQDRYADRERLTEGRRGHVCGEHGCNCGGWVAADPTTADHGGDPAHPWFACWVPIGGWEITAHVVSVSCTDRGCSHDRLLLNGCRLTRPPRKIVLVSTPGRGPLWQRITYTDALDTYHREDIP